MPWYGYTLSYTGAPTGANETFYDFITIAFQFTR